MLNLVLPIYFFIKNLAVLFYFHQVGLRLGELKIITGKSIFHHSYYINLLVNKFYDYGSNLDRVHNDSDNF